MRAWITSQRRRAASLAGAAAVAIGSCLSALADSRPADPRASPRPRGEGAPAAQPAAEPSPLGDWMVELNVARITIRPCGANLCGNVTWSKTGEGVGEKVLSEMRATGANRWEGTIHDPTKNRSFSSRISLSSPDKLRVEGCVLKFLCGGQTWTRTN